MKIYHVETQEDYDDLMVNLDKQGYLWVSDDRLILFPQYWDLCKENTCIILNSRRDFRVTRCPLEYAKEKYPKIPIIKHKAKGVEQMEKVVVPKFVADWYEGLTSAFLGNKMSELGHVSKRMERWIGNLETDDKYGIEIAQEIIAKMHLYGYEVEEEKKYYWRKKKEYMLDFEPKNYINVNKCGRVIFTGIYKGRFTETEIRELVSEEDFNKLERVEIYG